MLRWTVLGSGSEGNALVIEAQRGRFATRLLVDNGLGPRVLARRLARAGLTLEAIDAVFVTHEHADHAGGVAALLQRRPVPLLCSAGTLQAASLQHAEPCWQPARGGEPLALGELQLLPFSVPHDAAEPLQLVVSDGERRFGLLTDIGAPTDAVARALDGVHALQLECNHDAALLMAGPYPPFLKRRIAGDRGHLSNAQAADLLSMIDRGSLHTVAAAHLSRTNNTVDLARASIGAVLSGRPVRIEVADAAEGLDWIEV
jgi:phosphoribosyl 1,2-cyclic phosphodiesterase